MVMGEVYRTGRNCEGCGEGDMLRSGGDGGDRTGSNCDGWWINFGLRRRR